MRSVSLKDVRERLGSHSPACGELTAKQQAAVAMILRPNVELGVEMLLIKRGDREGDPWSGHMAFPGGRIEIDDASLQAAAERETLEEIGVDLANDVGLPLGQLAPLRPLSSPYNVAVTPFVYELSREPARYILNHEVAEVHWTPISPMMRGDSITRIDWNFENEIRSMPGFRVSNRTVWGMTYQMLNSLFRVIDPSFEAIV